MNLEKTTLDDWSKMWHNNGVYWHLSKPHYYLIKYFLELMPNKESTIFIPLCGKTVDIKWLYDNGYTVHGLEYEESAIIEFFNDFNIPYSKVQLSDDISVFKTSDSKIQLFQGDFFQFSEKYIDSKYDMVWDRGSFVAINVDDRNKYTKIINNILKIDGKIMLSAINYKPGSVTPPPYFVTSADVEKYFGDRFDAKYMESTGIGLSPSATDDLYILSPKI